VGGACAADDEAEDSDDQSEGENDQKVEKTVQERMEESRQWALATEVLPAATFAGVHSVHERRDTRTRVACRRQGPSLSAELELERASATALTVVGARAASVGGKPPAQAARDQTVWWGGSSAVA
jgi:hypothetical protein